MTRCDGVKYDVILRTMDIHITRKGEKHGPYPEATARQFLEEGKLSPTDLAWHAGADGWKPLSEVLAAAAQPPAAAPPPKPPGGGIPKRTLAGAAPAEAKPAEEKTEGSEAEDPDKIRVTRKGEPIGPYSREKAKEYFAAGQLLPTDWGWHDGMDEWKPLWEVLGMEVPSGAGTGTGPGLSAPTGVGGAAQLQVAHQGAYSRGELLLRTFFGFLYIGVPHGFCLCFLGLAANICSLIAWFAIIFTGNHPPGLYNFVQGIFQWQVRASVSLMNLVDGYPAFGLGNKGNEVSFNVNRPQTFSRGKCALRLLAFFYVIIPHGICLGLRWWATGILMMVLILIVLIKGQYPKGLHDFVTGTLRWQLRVQAYLAMLTDTYPRFSGKP